MKKAEFNYHARLVVRGLQEMSNKELRRLERWLLVQSKQLRTKSKEYSKLFTARLMK